MPLIPPPGRRPLQGRSQDVSYPPLHTWLQVPGSGFSARFTFRQTGNSRQLCCTSALGSSLRQISQSSVDQGLCGVACSVTRASRMGDLRAGQRQYQEGILPLHFLALPFEAAWTTKWSQECCLLSSGNSIGVVFGQQGNRAPVTGLTLPSSPAGRMVTESAAGKRTQDIEFPDEYDSSTWGLWSR